EGDRRRTRIRLRLVEGLYAAGHEHDQLLRRAAAGAGRRVPLIPPPAAPGSLPRPAPCRAWLPAAPGSLPRLAPCRARLPAARSRAGSDMASLNIPYLSPPLIERAAYAPDSCPSVMRRESSRQLLAPGASFCSR